MNELLTGAGVVLIVWRVWFLVRDRRFRRGRGPAPASWFDLGIQVVFALALLAIVAQVWFIDPDFWEGSNSTMPRWVFIAICLVGAGGILARVRQLCSWRRQRGGAPEVESAEP